MKIIIISLIIIGIVCIIVSFFLPDQTKQLKEELDQLSIQYYQDIYQLKKRIKILEEELLITSEFAPQKKFTKKFNPIIMNQVHLLAEQGLSVEQIAKQSALTTNEVKMILGKSEGRMNDE